jgi:polysaccharide biosynthesis protein PslH
MRILFAAPRFPVPATTADRLTVLMLLKYFARRHTVDLVCADDRPVSAEALNEVRAICGDVATASIGRLERLLHAGAAAARCRPLQSAYFDSWGASKAVNRLTEKNEYDLIYAHTLRAAGYVANANAPLRVIGMQISLGLHYKRLARVERNPFLNAVFRYEAKTLRRYEYQIARKFDRALVISQHDLDEICPEGDPRFFFSPHGVRLPDPAAPALSPLGDSIVFSGNMQFRPNVDAVLHFYRDIFPLVRSELPTARFYIVGRNPDPSVLALASDNAVEVTGEVDDVYAWLRRMTVAVDPLRAGAGLQNKVLEAMACGVPIAATPLANEGIQAVPGTHLLVAGDDEEFAAHVVALLKDERLRRSLGEAAKSFIEEKWTWDAHFQQLEYMIEMELKSRLADSG